MVRRRHRHRVRLLPVAGALALALVAFTATVVGPAGSAHAQAFEFRDFLEKHSRVERELERTQDLWNEVSARATQSNVPRVRDLVEQARRVQVRAKELLRAAEDANATAASNANLHLRNSLSFTLRARDLTTRAARQLREDLSQEENARRTLERARQQLERTEEGDARLRAQAAQLVDRAELQWRDGRFEQSLRLAQNALAVLETLRERDGEALDPERVAASLQRARERFERMRGDASDDEATLVRRLLDRAASSLRDGRPREAAQQILTARRVMDDAEGSGSRAGSRTERALRRLDAQIERIVDRFGDDLSEPARRLLRQAAEARDRARRALEADDESRAQQHIRAAADLLARLQRQVGRDRG